MKKQDYKKSKYWVFIYESCERIYFIENKKVYVLNLLYGIPYIIHFPLKDFNASIKAGFLVPLL